MHGALDLFSELEPADEAWLLANGAERALPAGEELLTEGVAPDDLFVVLDGLFEVRVRALGDRCLARVGPGELLGEVSFLERSVASAGVTAAEDARVLALSRELLERHGAQDPAFAARVYRTLGCIVARRLRERSIAASAAGDGARTGALRESDAWRALEPVVEGLKDLMKRAEHEARATDGALPDELMRVAEQGFDRLCRALTDVLGDGAGLGDELRDELGALVERELHPYLLLTRIVERIYSKPRGYAGDFLTIEWMYANEPGGAGRIGPLIDRLFLERPAAKAVRNRRGLLAEEIRAAVARSGGAGKVTSLACGPARELFDVFGELDDPQHLAATLIDIDLQALALVSDRRDKLGLAKRMKLHQGNLVYLATGREQLELEGQDLVYSIGLIDYFSDRFVVALLDWIHARLKPGGRVVLGNFHPRNPDRALMEHVLDWKLVHRDEDDMHRLLKSSAFGKPCEEIRYEEEGVNLFAVGVK